jgi:hypothetical protein
MYLYIVEHPLKWTALLVKRKTFFFGRLECVSQAYVAVYDFFRDVWIQSQRTAGASRRATNLATHPQRISYPSPAQLPIPAHPSIPPSSTHSPLSHPSTHPSLIHPSVPHPPIRPSSTHPPLSHPSPAHPPIHPYPAHPPIPRSSTHPPLSHAPKPCLATNPSISTERTYKIFSQIRSQNQYKTIYKNRFRNTFFLWLRRNILSEQSYGIVSSKEHCLSSCRSEQGR